MQISDGRRLGMVVVGILMAAPAAVACEAETTEPTFDNERFLAGCGGMTGCDRWACLWAECGVAGALSGAAGACKGGGPPGALIWGSAAFVGCGFAQREALIDAYQQCSVDMGPLPPQPLTGTAGAECFDPEDPETYPELTCGQIIESRTWTKCTTTVVSPEPRVVQTCSEVSCGGEWSDACQHDYEVCLETTVPCDDDEDEDGDDGDGQACALPTVPLDADGDGEITVFDAAAVMRNVEAAPGLADVNGDGEANADDRDYLVEEVLGAHYGDANLDGEFSSSDWVLVMSSGHYDNETEALWTDGDFDGDGFVTTADLVLAMSSGCYEQGPDC